METLQRMARQIGPGISDLWFQIHIDGRFSLGDGIALGADRFHLSVANEADGEVVFTGRWQDVQVTWTFTPAEGGYWVRLRAEGDHGLNCPAMDSLILSYHPDGDDFAGWRVPGRGAGFDREGMFKVKELVGGSDSGLLGVFRDSKSAGLFAATRIPQRHVHQYGIQRDGDAGVRLTCTTHFVEGFRGSQALASEATWVCATKAVTEAINTYASHLPCIAPAPAPPVGWNSWDYYFRAVTIDDLIENMEAIREDPVLSPRVRYIVLDDGWHHTDGEWYTNYRFPGGLERIAGEIVRRGFIPGIWTAPLFVEHLSTTALRSCAFLIKDAYGDPAPADTPQRYLVDPTHPLGKEFLRDLYTRLYDAGFRFFKIDFVYELLKAERFHDPGKGPYDALRDLYALIRACVTGESHIMSVPVGCGPGYADSGRIGIDIHNQWTHVEWVAEWLQLSYWLHNRLFVNDPDFLIVRGKQTSLEQETNVLNPKANHPTPPRWRRGPAFTLDEAQTWANIVALAGGSVFLSDRIRMLNEAGRELVRRVFEKCPTGVAARPLDLCDGDRASFWLQELADAYRLGIINWSAGAQTSVFSFEEYGLKAPAEVADLWTGVTHQVGGDKLGIRLAAHQSVIVHWPKNV